MKQFWEPFWLSICLSVRPFSWCSCPHIIMNFSGVITITKVMSIQKFKVKFEFTDGYIMTYRACISIEEVFCYLFRASVKFQGHMSQKWLILTPSCRTAPIWIHQWFWSNARSIRSIEEVRYCFSRSSFKVTWDKKNHQFWPKLRVFGLLLQCEFTDGFEMMHKAWCSIEEVPYYFSRSSVKYQGHMG